MIDSHRSGRIEVPSTIIGSFRHPGLLSDAREIARFTQAANQPGTPEHSAYELLKSEVDFAGMPLVEHQPQPVRTYRSVPHHREPGPARQLLDDARAAYGNALLWLVSRDQRHADAANRILSAWCDTLVEIVDETGRRNHWLAARHGYQLFTSYSWPAMVWTAELLRADPDSGFDVSRQARFADLLRRVVRPAGVHPANAFPNNWRSWRTALQVTLAVYLDDGVQFEVAVHEFCAHAIDYLGDDLRGEMKRDLWHAQMGIAGLLVVAETAWKQGVDLYAFHDCLLLRAMEYLLPFCLGDREGWPFEQPPVLSRQPDGHKLWTMYELAYNHYHRRLELPTPQMERLFETNDLAPLPGHADRFGPYRPEGFNRMGFGTLTHSGGS